MAAALPLHRSHWIPLPAPRPAAARPARVYALEVPPADPGVSGARTRRHSSAATCVLTVHGHIDRSWSWSTTQTGSSTGESITRSSCALNAGNALPALRWPRAVLLPACKLGVLCGTPRAPRSVRLPVCLLCPCLCRLSHARRCSESKMVHVVVLVHARCLSASALVHAGASRGHSLLHFHTAWRVGVGSRVLPVAKGAEGADRLL